MLPPLVGPGTIVIGFQNGVETVASLTRAVGRRTPPAACRTSRR